MDSHHQGKTTQFLFQQQSCHADDSVVPQMDWDWRKGCESLSNWQRVEKTEAFSAQLLDEREPHCTGDSLVVSTDLQSNKQEEDQSEDSSDSGVQQSNEQQMEQEVEGDF